MANPTCTTASLNVACFRGYNLSRLQKKAFMIWYLANELAAIGGTNYTSLLTNGATGLRNVTQQQFKNWSRDEMDSALVAIFYNNAVAAGASVSADPNSVIVNVRRLEGVNEDDLNKMMTELFCQLGVHKNYPQ